MTWHIMEGSRSRSQGEAKLRYKQVRTGMRKGVWGPVRSETVFQEIRISVFPDNDRKFKKNSLSCKKIPYI